MGELVPIIAFMFLFIVIIACFFIRKQLSMKQVVKPLSEADMVERDRYVLSLSEAELLSAAMANMVSKVKERETVEKYDLLMRSKILTIEVRKNT